MTAVRIGCIVEGHGEADALPVLVRRIAAELLPATNIDIKVFVRESQPAVIGGNFENHIDRAANRVGADGFVLVLVDSEEDLPCRLGPSLLARARKHRPDRDISIVAAHRCFETWFLHGADFLRGGKFGLPDSSEPPPEAEAWSPSRAKEWLGTRRGRRYSETVDQAKFAARLDVAKLRARSDSFDKLVREIERMLKVAVERL